MQTNNDFKVNASQEFAVPVDQLYAAWTSPELLKKWWKPMNNTLTEVTNELKEGGTVKYVFKENNLTITGKYSEVKENERLAYTWDWEFAQDVVKNASYKLTVEFKSNGNGSAIAVTQENFKNEEGTVPHQEGWNKGLEDLKQFLDNKGGDSSSAGETDKSGGYNESPEQAKVGGG